MQFFHVTAPQGSAALVYHSYLDGQCYCRTRSDSFRKAFDEVCARTLNRFVRENQTLYAYPFGPGDHGWAEAVLSEVCQGDWVYEELDPKTVTGSFDDLVERYLSN
jgi:hypothetical protein